MGKYYTEVLRCPKHKIDFVDLGERVKEALYTGRGVMFRLPRAKRIMRPGF